MLEFGIDTLGFKHVSAITTPNNERSGLLLAKLGFSFDRLISMSNGDELRLFTFST